MDPLSLLAIFGPLAVDAGKAVIQKFIAPDEFKPVKIEDYIAMRNHDLEMFKAMNEAGGTNPSYLWVEAVVRLMRPAVAIITIGSWAYLAAINQSNPTVDNFAAAVAFFLFGDRTLFYSRKQFSK